MIEIFVFFVISSFISVFSGRFFLKLSGLDVKKSNISFSEQGIFGLIFISFLSLILNFFFKIDQNLASLIILIPFFQLLFERKVFSKIIIKKFFFHLISISLLCAIFIIYDNVNRPDSGIYHLPFTKIINDFKIFFGIVSLNPVFGATSILQYTSAIFNNLIFKDVGVTIPLALISIYLIEYFLRQFFKTKISKVYKFFLLLIIPYIFLEMNRYSEYGNDNVGHLLLFYLVTLILRDDFNLRLPVYFKLFTLISLFIFLNKVFLSLTLLLPIVIWFKYKFYLKKKFYPLFSLFFFGIWIIKNILISGCAIYPIQITCNENLDWYSNNPKFIIAADNLSQFGELHAKGWSEIVDEKKFINYENNLEIKKNFLDKFNWLMSDQRSQKTSFGFYKLFNNYIFFVIFLFLFFILYRIAIRQKRGFYFKFEDYLIISISLLSLFLLIYKFPLGRYGTSYFVIIIFYIFNFLFENKFAILNLNKIKKFFSVLIIVSSCVFILKNMSRIILNYGVEYNQSPWPRIYENSEKLANVSKNSNLPIKFKNKNKNNILKIYYVNDLNYWTSDRSFTCMYNRSPCSQTSNNFDNFQIIKTPKNYYMIKLNKN